LSLFYKRGKKEKGENLFPIKSLWSAGIVAPEEEKR
jgi:hypothetical protein